MRVKKYFVFKISERKKEKMERKDI